MIDIRGRARRWRMLTIGLPIVAAIISNPAQAVSDYDARAILNSMPMNRVSQGRLMCASGIRGEMVMALGNGLGGTNLPSVGKECVSYLVRFARLGQFGRPPGLKGNRAPIALAIDESFMAGYQARKPLPDGLPTLATLLPIVERCYLTREPNGKLCAATGYAIGARIAAGEALA